jgi:hypothetical protein
MEKIGLGTEFIDTAVSETAPGVVHVDGVVQQTETKKDKYWDAPEVKEIAQKLLSEDGAFAFPQNTPILYVFVDRMKDWGRCTHCSAQVKFACAYEFIITINHTAWSVMDDKCRSALVFHELCHIGYDMLKDKYSLRDHDVEEFGRVISRYGLWTEDVKRFVDAAMKSIMLAEEQEDANHASLRKLRDLNFVDEAEHAGNGQGKPHLFPAGTTFESDSEN